MVFSSVTFLFLFLPTVLLLHFLVRRELRNGLLLLSSLIYYAWGESRFVLVVLVVIAGNYLLGLALQGVGRELPRKLLLGLAVTANIGLLFCFKYAGSFLRAMAGFGKGSGGLQRAAMYWDHERLLALGMGVVGSTPLIGWLGRQIQRQTTGRAGVFYAGKLLAMALMATVSAIRLSSGTYNPFIYFRF